MGDDAILEQVDSLMSEAFAPERPMSAPEEGTLANSEATAASAPVSAETPWVIKHGGKDIALDDHKYRMYAQKGYDYQDKMHQLRVDRNLYAKDREDFDNQRQTFQAEYDELKQINDYAKANPQWLDTVRSSWQQVQQGGQHYSQQTPEMLQLRSKVEQLASVLADQEKMANMRAIAEKDATLESSIANYRDAHSDFDWEKEDDSGLKLEQRIMQHAIDGGIKSFQAAARDYLWDEHMTRAQLQTKEKVGKELQKQTKFGFGTPTSTSQMQVTRAENLRKKSYHDMAQEALRELGLG